MRDTFKERILVVDDVSESLDILRRNLTAHGFQIYVAPNVAAAIEILESTGVDLVITDHKLPDLNGLDLIRHVRENLKNTGIIMMTGQASIGGAVEAVRIGAEDYLATPFSEAELFRAIERALEKHRMRKSGLADYQTKPVQPYGLIGNSSVMRRVFDSISKVATTSATVLITGESGTGKELVARSIHYSSSRASAPFVPINCGAIPEGLLESELFGHVKGAFTGASESRAGFFQTADGGTIFLDEVSETSASMQVKLLRVLQDKEVCMVGDTRPRKVDIRIVIATNKDLISLVKKGAFREDLYFRLSVITITIPPLRQRGDDILTLTHHFIAKFANELGKPSPPLTDGAMNVLRKYDWPGNVRELENLTQRLVLMIDGNSIDIPDLPANMRFSAMRPSGLDRTLADVETEYINNVLSRVNGNKSRAAEILGIDRKTLREKLKNLDSSSSDRD